LDNLIFLPNNIFFARLAAKISPQPESLALSWLKCISPKVEVISKNRQVLVILLIVSHHSPDNVSRAYYPRAKNSAAIPCPA